MSPEQMRKILMDKYNQSVRVSKMSDSQIYAMYMRLLESGKLK
jgi:hypothetical protein